MSSPQVWFVVLAVGITASATDVTPVQKVITMLEDLMTQTIVEGKAEAKTYDEFACFCKDNTEDKTYAIQEGTDRVASLEASIADEIAFRNKQQQFIAAAHKALAANAEMEKRGREKRAKEHAQFLEEKADLNLIRKEIIAARDALMEGVAEPEKTIIPGGPVFLEALTRVKKMRQEQPAGTPQEKIVNAALNPLESDADDAWKKIHTREEKEKNDLTILLQEVHDVEKHQEGKINKAQAKSQTASDDIGRMGKELTMTSAKLTDDKAYLTELTASCNAKSKSWDQRSKMRADELTALGTALNILKGTVSEKVASGKTVRFLSIENAKKSVMAPVDDDVKPTSFIQLHSARNTATTLLRNWDTKENPMARLADRFSEAAQKADARRNALESEVPVQKHVDFEKRKVVDLLKTRAATMHSQRLVSFATELSGSPFDKITKLIQELIERLLQEAADEANHQGWCTKQLTEVKAQRGRKVDAVATLNGQLAASEALRDQLKEDISILAAEIAELEDALAKATSARGEESEENAATIKEAEEGAVAVSQALDTLDKFYKTAAKASLIEEVSPSLLQASGQQPDLPDAGFDGPYQGGQGGAHGILGMMEVIKSDFERTVKVTTKAEKDAAADFLEFETNTKQSLGVKTNTKSAKEAELRETVDTINEDLESLKSEQALLDKALQELVELQPACFPKQMSYEERVAKREQEIAALKEALCTLDKEGPVQTEAGDCGTLGF